VAFGRHEGARCSRNSAFRSHTEPNREPSGDQGVRNRTDFLRITGGIPTLPTALATIYNAEVDNSVNNDRTTPNVHPDIIGKLVIEPSSRFHFEVGGVEKHRKNVQYPHEHLLHQGRWRRHLCHLMRK
jgi:hypothetical protein